MISDKSTRDKSQEPEVRRRPPALWLLTSSPRLLFCVVAAHLLFLAGGAMAQTDVIGSHNLSLAGSAPALSGIGSCAYCHAPHSGLNGKAGAMPTPLWNQALSQVASYPLYSSATMQNLTNGALTLGTESTLCLSCHDGTVALGATAAYGQVPVGTLSSQDNLGTNLSTIHPFNFVLNNGQFTCFSSAQSSLCANPPATANPAVPLINGNIQCTSCHNPHVQYADPAGNFLVVNNTSGALCLACHSTVPTGTGMRTLNVRRTTAGVMASTTAGVMEHNTNPLAGWRTSMHALATNRVAPQVSLDDSAAGPTRTGSRRSMSLGPYGTVSKNACSSCHASHNAQGGGSLLRAPDDQTCIVCHNGSSNTSPPSPNILAEMVAPRNGHAFSTGDTVHRAREAALLNQNRHVGCVDCHNPHSTGRVTNFAAAPTVRASQAQVIGISAADGRTVVSPAADQYENCLRCHGTSNGKKATINYGYLPLRVVAAPDPLDVIPEFNSLAASSHPVFRDRRSMFPQPSLRLNMLNLDGKTPGRLMGTRMMCTDCHNSDDNREFGGNGPNGPHGSIFPHILERRYEFSRAAIPGRVVTNLFPFPDLSAQGGASGGPYALCAKCHDLRQVMNTTSFTEHARHVQADGFSCSVCHTAHGMGAQSEGISGERLVNFDGNIVAPEGSAQISYDRATNSCSLVCHNHVHKGPSKLSISAFRR